MAPAPPPAMPQNVKVARGKKVEIPLRIFGRQSEALRYVIKTPPAHGQLSEQRVIDRQASAVTYEPPADLKIKADRFTFSVQSSVGVSAPVEVNIAIVDEAPLLAMPALLEFGQILAGATATKEFELVNRGGGIADGELKLRPPWKVEGNARYQLGAGETAHVKIVFAPTEGGDFRGEIQYTSNLDHTTAVRGSGAMPVSAEPATVTLRHEPGFALRTGVFEIVNRTDEPRVFQLTAGPRLRVEAEASVPAGGRLAVAIGTQASDVASLNDTVRVEGDGVTLRVPVKAPPVGPILRVTQQRVRFGRMPADRGGQAPILLENLGGTTAEVTCEVREPFALVPPTIALAPGEKRQVMLAIQPAAPGPYRGWLKLQSPPVVAEIEIEAELVGTSGSGRTASSNPRVTRPRTPGTRPPAAEEEPEWTPDMEGAKEVRITALRPSSARLQWPAAMGSGNKFKLERLILTKDSAGELRTVWLDLPQVTLSREGAQWFAEMNGLTPGQSQTIRVVPLDDAGAAGTTLFRIDFSTPPAPQGLRVPSLLQALVGLLVLCGAALAWKRFRAAQAS